MGLFSLVVYGVGDMVGSGIYGTIGRAADKMGNAVWLAFVVSMIAAVFTGLSYACLASRYPRAAGAAFVTHRAFRFAFLSYLIGLTVTASGLTSMATQTNVVADNVYNLLRAAGEPRSELLWTALALAFLGVMTFINFWGIRQSMWTNIACTAIEVGGLLFIIAIGVRFWGGVNYLEAPAATFDAAGRITSYGLGPSLVLTGAVLTFFSFIGFEDMLNIGEEVKNPHRTMPRGILLAIAIATLLYISVAITAVSVVDHRTLADSAGGSPLSKIAQRAAPRLPLRTFDCITIFAAANTMLINYIMGSRLLYGMARQGLLPAFLGRVHATRHTPHLAILTLLAIVATLAFSTAGDRIGVLAKSTSLLLLTAFLVVNAALIVLKLRPDEPRGRFEVPIAIPAIGILVNLTLIAAPLFDPAADWRPVRIAGILVACIAAIYLLIRPKNVTEEVLATLE
jgi:amino acid transporter